MEKLIITAAICGAEVTKDLQRTYISSEARDILGIK